MKTNLIYYQNAYQNELHTKIIAINQTPEGRWNIQLADTIFYPEGGGQPGDKGLIIGQNGTANLLFMKTKDEKLIHACTVEGKITDGEAVKCQLDWDWRYKYMKVHSAGHLVHDVLLSIVPSLVPLKGGHGNDAFVEYRGNINPSLLEKITDSVNAKIKADLEIKTWESSVAKLQHLCQFIPPNLPSNKPIRAIQIGDFAPMPDGGVQVKSTSEIGEVRITSIQNDGDKSKITYQVINT